MTTPDYDWRDTALGIAFYVALVALTLWWLP